MYNDNKEKCYRVARKNFEWQVKKRKKKLETHPIDFSNAIGEYTSNNVLVDIDTEENEINITYIPNEDIVYKFQITVHYGYPFSAPRLHFMTIEEYDKDGKKKNN